MVLPRMGEPTKTIITSKLVSIAFQKQRNDKVNLLNGWNLKGLSEIRAFSMSGNTGGRGMSERSEI